jgi:membrane protease YdiL (CAAX protease family)/energy-coupling factor transporter ATP-binding protein EcfA2
LGVAPDDVLVLDGLGKDFGTTVALEALSCRVQRGEIVGLLGPNGAGKTTTMKLVLGMLRPSRGSASFLGLDCTRDAQEAKRRLGYSPDEPVFYDFLNGKETIDFAFMLIGGAPVVAKLPRGSHAVRWILPAASALLDGGGLARLLVATFVLGLLGALGIRTAERIGYDRVDIVPTRKLATAPSAELDLVRIEKVLAKREPGGLWMARGAFLYTLAASAGLLAVSLLPSTFAREASSVFVRSLGYVAIFSGFAVVQARATRMVVRDAAARAMLAPLPIGPNDLLRGKTRALLVQALFVASPYFLLLALPGPMSLRLEVLWRGGAAMAALVLAASAMVAVAFLTQGLGGVKVLGGNVGIETMLVAMPLLAVAAAPYLWSAMVSLTCLALLAFEARRSALQCVRWIDDADDFQRETPVWRALLVFGAFQAAQTLGRRALAFAPIDEHIQAALAYVVAALALLALTLHGRRGLPRMRALPSHAPRWIVLAVLAGALSGAFAVGFRAFLRKIGVDVPPGASDADVRLVIAAVTVVLAPIAEETFFRGWLQNTLEGELPERRRWAAPLLAALAFASVRAPMSVVPIFVLGVIAGSIYARTGSRRAVGPSIAAHAVHVAVSLAARYFLGV